MGDKYLECLGMFYEEKVKFLSSKDNFISCGACPNKKEFVESYEMISLSCGSDDKECGIKLKITFPKYLHFESEISKLKEKLKDGLNLSVINNYIDVSSELKKQTTRDDKIKEEIKNIREKFDEINMKNKKEYIQKFYDSRIDKTKRCKEIYKKINEKELDSRSKKELMKEYINNVKSLNEEYMSAQNIINSITPYYKVKEAIVELCDMDIVEEKVKKKKKVDKKEKVDKKDKVDKKEKVNLEKGDNVSWEMKGKVLYGVISKNVTAKGKRVSVSLENGKVLLVPKESLNVISEQEPEPEIDSDSDVEVEDDEDDEQKEQKEQKEEISYFSKSKDNKWLSTFNVAEPFKYDGLEYPSVENAFHAQKVDPDDPRNEEYKTLFTTYTDDVIEPSKAKKMGGKTFFEENDFKLRGDWDKIKLKIMEDITREYYLANRSFLDKLMETGDKRLAHRGFRIDPYWGETKKGGENNHGKILMKLREEFA